MSLNLKTPQDIRMELAKRAKERRLSMDLSQGGVARRAGISPGTIKRFEKTGHISIDSLLNIAFVLDAADAFSSLFRFNPAPYSIDDLFVPTYVLKKRGRKK